ncbi:MAG: L-lactate dehydrogenase [Bacillota bacterium]|jgi:L-lactate dehydrogenase|nr:L-lactate dehydrogenase [Bacillota bacterium]NLU55067.1 L-lactate dehydrogenase [Bacillota bacterium]HOJ45841.1 L-lactate dehydrogenase [Bacillota bacterium]HOL13305.1 L-lactate dehydrogenase [Bacillota bacterium]HQD78095.1 L-lactate dehydrogenase [Bacillota bacterium]
MKQVTKPTRVVIVGTGFVGSSFAYALAQAGLVSEIVLIDIDRKKAEGEAMDINHGIEFVAPVKVWAGDYSDVKDADVIVITAGVNQKPGETRLDLTRTNSRITKDVCSEIVKYTKDAIIVMTANPVDILTYVTLKETGYPPNQVIGSGTLLDTARFRFLLGQHLGVDPRSVHAYIIGEHGDSELPVWSSATVGGVPINKFCHKHPPDVCQATLNGIFEEVKNAAYEIIERKGATYYAIGWGLMRIVQAIVKDQRSVLTVSTLLDNYLGISDVCLGIPVVVSRSGIERVVELELSEDEYVKLNESANVLKAMQREIGY